MFAYTSVFWVTYGMQRVKGYGVARVSPLATQCRVSPSCYSPMIFGSSPPFTSQRAFFRWVLYRSLDLVKITPAQPDSEIHQPLFYGKKKEY